MGKRPSDYPHQPVMVREVIQYLVTDPNGIYVDGTTGSGGHSEAILNVLEAEGRLICLDRDSKVLDIARGRLTKQSEGRVFFMKANYTDMGHALEDLGFSRINGVLLDLGVSSFQLDTSGRGFSFKRDEPLDMRMDPGQDVTAFEVVNESPQKDLERILRHYGEERRARAVSRAIIRSRKKKPITTSLQLSHIIQSVIPPSRRPGARHPATRAFQAFRIAVNQELTHLAAVLETFPSLILKGGRVVILSYHSLEDRLVKRSMAE